MSSRLYADRPHAGPRITGLALWQAYDRIGTVAWNGTTAWHCSTTTSRNRSDFRPSSVRLTLRHRPCHGSCPDNNDLRVYCMLCAETHTALTLPTCSCCKVQPLHHRPSVHGPHPRGRRAWHAREYCSVGSAPLCGPQVSLVSFAVRPASHCVGGGDLGCVPVSAAKITKTRCEGATLVARCRLAGGAARERCRCCRLPAMQCKCSQTVPPVQAGGPNTPGGERVTQC